MLHPYQRLAVAKLSDAPVKEILLAACGPQLFTFDLENGVALGTWPLVHSKDKQDDSDSSTEIITASTDRDGRIRKRRKIAKNKSSDDGLLGSAITLLAVSKDCRHVVATTGEDKEVHVFEIGRDGQLDHLSKRRMTKRPCAIGITPDDEFIIVGDKFGDVYALPLCFNENESQAAGEVPNGHTGNPSPYKPSATNLTVHTHRNLAALKQQMRHVPTATPKTKDVMSFPHELLLGHVSMLTDLVSTSISSPHVPGVDREYIITCDRDEHVRVSRGRTQAHLIENYCFGHTQFVSRLCLIRPNILVSGGGDNHLFVWDWPNGRLLGKLPLQEAVENYRTSKLGQELQTDKSKIRPSRDQELQDSDAIAVSGIWSASSATESVITVLCACEAIPAVFEFALPLTESGTFSEKDVELKTFELPGNVLDLAFFANGALVSVDNVHEPETTSMVRDKARNHDHQPSKLCGLFNDGSFQSLEMGRYEGRTLIEDNDFQKLTALLYSVENLRKHSGEDAE